MSRRQCAKLDGGEEGNVCKIDHMPRGSGRWPTGCPRQRWSDTFRVHLKAAGVHVVLHWIGTRYEAEQTLKKDTVFAVCVQADDKCFLKEAITKISNR